MKSTLCAFIAVSNLRINHKSYELCFHPCRDKLICELAGTMIIWTTIIFINMTGFNLKAILFFIFSHYLIMYAIFLNDYFIPYVPQRCSQLMYFWFIYSLPKYHCNPITQRSKILLNWVFINQKVIAISIIAI